MESGPLVRSAELLEAHLGQKGRGVSAAVRARLARRRLPHVDPETFVAEPALAVPQRSVHSGRRGAGADVEWVLAGEQKRK